MEKNRRSTDRNKPTADLKGKFILYAGSNAYDVYLVRDVSPFGIGVKISEMLVMNTRIRLSYVENSNSYEVRGNVVWSSADGTADDGTKLYATGVLFTPMDTSINIEFYNLLMGYNPD